MSSPDTIEALNRLLAILSTSFPQYLKYAHPYLPPGSDRLLDTVHEIVDGQESMAERVARLVESYDGLPDRGEFPIEYTDSHDLSIDFLVRKAIDYQRIDIAEIERLAEALRHNPAAKALADETLGMAKAHLELLAELVEPASGDNGCDSETSATAEHC